MNEIHKKSDRWDILKDQLKKYPTTIVRTSGSTSKPVYVCLNDYDIKAITDVGARCLSTAGLHAGIIVANTMSSNMWAGGTLDSLSIAKTGATLVNYSVGNTKELVQTILDLGITALHCTPSYLDKIASVAKDEYGLEANQLGIKLLLVGGEAGTQNPDFRKRVEAKWNANLIDANYGQADSVSIFAAEDFRYKNGLTFLGYPEVNALVQTKDNKIVTPSLGIKGELLVTTLWSNGLVSCKDYHTGDIIEVTEVLPDNKFRFKVVGRTDDMLVVRGLNVYPSTVKDVFEKFLMEYGIDAQMQIHVSKSDPIEHIELWINKPLLAEWVSELELELKKATSIHFIVRSVINLIEGNTGKIKTVIRNL